MQTVSCPGFRFRPTDEELLSCYLRRKVAGADGCLRLIAEVDFCKFEPWDLPYKSSIQTKDLEWFFFSQRGQKYPNGSQTRRATRSGYWKATGKERPVKSGCEIIGSKRTLVFYVGRAPKAVRTEWIMHEFSLKGSRYDALQDSFVVCRLWKREGTKRGRLDVDTFDQSDLSRETDANIPLNGDHSASKVGQSQLEVHGGKKQNAMECSSDWQIGGLKSVLHILGRSMEQQTSFPGENLYSEILNDSIIDLGNFPSYGSLFELPSVEDGTKYGVLAHSTATSTSSFMSVYADPKSLELGSSSTSYMPTPQGTAHRRIRLKKQRNRELDNGREESGNLSLAKTNAWWRHFPCLGSNWFIIAVVIWAPLLISLFIPFTDA